jgi:hypothetical protein
MKTRNQFTRIILALFCAVLTLTAAAADYPYYGSQLADLDALIAKEPQNVLIVKFDESDGFTANINIQIKRFPGTMKEYIEISHKEYDQLFDKKWSTPSENQKGEKEYLVELMGTAKGREFHFYVRAVKHEEKVYLITATALQSQWATVGDKMRRYVDSFHE